ncbi:hypothetical protein NL108_015662 [Boleophthalmus pectinirostris]|nr:hypothetical protein NL108_015662 [Boleophthalmus pectinirostris]
MAKYFKEAEEKSEARHKKLEKRLDSMNAVLSRHTEEIKTLRQDTGTLQEHVARVEKEVDERDTLLYALTAKVTEMEDRARRDNLLILNLKEGVEGTNTLAYLRENIPKWFPAFAPAPPELMRAHRLGHLRSTPPGKTLRPRPLIINCLRFTDRDALLKEARRNAPEVEGSLLKFAADYSEHTSKRRRACYKTMHEARVKGFDAFLLYPATIKLQRGHDSHFFSEPAKAEKFLDSLSKD